MKVRIKGRTSSGKTPKVETVSVRLDPDLLERLDALAAKMRAVAASKALGRADALRELLIEGLDRREAEGNKAKTGDIGAAEREEYRRIVKARKAESEW